MKNRKRQLDYKDIGEFRRKELENFCLQYSTFVREKRLDLTEMIEQSAIFADADIYQYLLKHVTTKGSNYDSTKPPCGRRQFYNKLNVFFKMLSAKRYK